MINTDRELLKVKLGEIFLAREHEVGKVFTFISGLRDLLILNFSQVSNKEIAEIHLFHGDEVNGILSAIES